MANTFNELLEKAGGDAEEAVTKAKKRWNQQVREILRDLTRFKFQSRSTNDQPENLVVPISIEEGLPNPLKPLEQEVFTTDDRKAYELISLWQADLQSLKTIGVRLDHNLDSLYAIPSWTTKATHYSADLGKALSVVYNLLDLAKRATMLRRVVGIDEDVLGVYWHSAQSDSLDFARIELYWLVIGAAARWLGVSVEGLAVVTLAHELAHAYTHMGMDIDGHRWDSRSFTQSDKAVKEGVAQYYTVKVVERLNERGYMDALAAYEALVIYQPEPYKVHRHWLEQNLSPEVMRAMMLKIRSGTEESARITHDWAEFDKVLNTLPKQLGRERSI